MIDSVGANSYFAILVAHATYSTEVHQSGFRPHHEATRLYTKIGASVQQLGIMPHQKLQYTCQLLDLARNCSAEWSVMKPHQELQYSR